MHHTKYQLLTNEKEQVSVTLTKAQIEQVRTFIHSRGFTHIEVEMEILDHVASAVEVLLTKEPNLSLEKAIQKVHMSFGIMGFSVFEDEIKTSLGKKMMRMYRQQLWHYWSSIKALKMITTAILIFAALTFWFNLLDPDLFRIAAYITVGIIGSIPAFYQNRSFKKWGKKSLMLGQMLWPFLLSAMGATYLIQVLPMDYLAGDRVMFNLVLAFLALLVSTTTWASISFTREVYQYTQKHWLKFAQ